MKHYRLTFDCKIQFLNINAIAMYSQNPLQMSLFIKSVVQMKRVIMLMR